MGKTRLSAPLLFQSKLLLISLAYLFTVLFLALFTSHSPTTCLFRSSPFDPVQSALFSYPRSYGQHKYAIPTHRSSCSSPLYFPDYWEALEDIQSLCKNSLVSLPSLKYVNGKSEFFGGNFSTQKRISYFNHSNASVEIPCGFFKKFPIQNSDRIMMESCNGAVVLSAVFNDHDKIRQPKSIGSKTMDHVCFFMFVDDVTLTELFHHRLLRKESREYTIGVWRIIKVSSKRLYENPAMNGMIPKYLGHRLFPNSKFSIWIDAKLQLMVDPILLIHSLLVSSGVDVAISKHPHFVHTMEEAMATARWKKWSDVRALRMQMEAYCDNGLHPWSPNKLPFPSDVPDSALILRRHGERSNLFSCLVFNELEAFNPRDQLAFAYVRDLMNPKIKLNMFEAEVFEQVALEYRHTMRRNEAGSPPKSTLVSHDELVGLNGFNKCSGYLSAMWGQSHA